MREGSKQKLGKTVLFQLELGVINKHRKREEKKTYRGRSLSIIQPHTEDLSLWTAGLEARHHTLEKDGPITSIGSPAAYFQTHLLPFLVFCFNK